MSSKPAKPPKPFPWKCQHCFKDEVVIGTTSYDAEVRHDGRLHKFTIPQLHLPICQACGEKVFTENVDDQIGSALRGQLGLLSPDNIRAGLIRLNLTQKEIAERLGIAEATLSRWLNDIQIQSRVYDNLLRLYFTFENVRSALADEANLPRLGVETAAEPSTAGKSPGDTESDGELGPWKCAMAREEKPILRLWSGAAA